MITPCRSIATRYPYLYAGDGTQIDGTFQDQGPLIWTGYRIEPLEEAFSDESQDQYDHLWIDIGGEA